MPSDRFFRRAVSSTAANSVSGECTLARRQLGTAARSHCPHVEALTSSVDWPAFFPCRTCFVFPLRAAIFRRLGFRPEFAKAGISAIPGFFLLSGFILTYAHVHYPGRIDQPTGKFWLARFFRIYPAYFLAFLLAAPFALARFPHTGISLHTLADTGAFLLLSRPGFPICEVSGTIRHGHYRLKLFSMRCSLCWCRRFSGADGIGA